MRCHANTLSWHPGVPATVSFDKYWQIIRPFSAFLHQFNLEYDTNLLVKTHVRSTKANYLSVHSMYILMQETEEKELSPLTLDFIIKSTPVILPLGGL